MAIAKQIHIAVLCCYLSAMNAEQKKSDDRTKEYVEDGEANYVLYGVEDVPSPPVCFLFGLQVSVVLVVRCIEYPCSAQF